MYDAPYGGEPVGRVDVQGFMYSKPYGGRKVGRHEDGKVYRTAHGGKPVARVKDKDGAGFFLLRGKRRRVRREE